jgi:hypothetical protein
MDLNIFYGVDVIDIDLGQSLEPMEETHLHRRTPEPAEELVFSSQKPHNPTKTRIRTP